VGDYTKYDINEGVKSVLVITRNEYKYHAEVEIDLGDIPHIYCHPGQINEVLMNIIVDAAQAIKSQNREEKLFASSAKEALQIIDKEPVHVLVTDLRMPEMDDLALIKEVKKRKPDIVRVVLSGYSQVPTLLAAINEGDVLRYLTKPWNSEEEFRGSYGILLLTISSF